MTLNSTLTTPKFADALVIGESLIDVVSASFGTHEYPGGSPANVAYGLSKLGTGTALWTALGEDRLGGILRSHLVGAGVEVLDWAKPLASTSTAKVRLADDGSAEYEFSVDWNIQDVNLPWLPTLLHIGSAAAFTDPGCRAVENAVLQCAGKSIVTFDPNIRPELIPPHGESLATFERIAALANVVKLSDEDAHWLYPGRSNSQVAQHALSLGPDLVVITRGALGAILTSADTAITVPPVTTTVSDTIGAGDSYMAALIFSILSAPDAGYGAQSLERIGRVAAAAAAITVGRSGANPPFLAELEEALIQQRPTGSSLTPSLPN